MENVQRLRDVLVASSDLLDEFISVSSQELESAVNWDTDRVDELTKRKETLLANESVLDKSKAAIMNKLYREMGLSSAEMSLPVVIEALEASSPLRDELELVRGRIEGQILELKHLSAQLKSVYSTNKRLCEGFFQSVGIANSGVYDNSPWKPSSGGSDISTISFRG